MNKVSNEIAGVMHFAGVFVVTFIAGMLLGLFLAPIYLISGLIGGLVSGIVGLVILYFSIVLVARLLKDKVSYSDSDRVAFVATFINAILSIFTILLALPNLAEGGFILILNTLVSLAVFYVVSKNNL